MNRRARRAQKKERRTNAAALVPTASLEHFAAVARGIRARAEEVGAAEVKFERWHVKLTDPKSLPTDFETICQSPHRHWALSFTARTEKPDWGSFGMILAAFGVPEYAVASNSVQFQLANYEAVVDSPVHVVWTEPHDKACAACQHAESIAVSLMAKRLQLLSLPPITRSSEHPPQSN